MAELRGGVQRATVTVRGGYSPEVLRVRQGVPVELTFDRQEAGDCTSRVVFPDFFVSAALPAHHLTTVRLDPAEAGEFGFACGMNMVHGSLIVEAAPERDLVSPGPDTVRTRPAATPQGLMPTERLPPRLAEPAMQGWRRTTPRPRSVGPRSGTWRFA